MKRIAFILFFYLLSVSCRRFATPSEAIGIIENTHFEEPEPLQIEIDTPVQGESPAITLTAKEELITELMSEMTLEEKVGQMLFLSFETSENGGALIEMDTKTIEAMKVYKPGGIIYFAANINTAEQTLALSREFQKNSEIPLFIATDEEGGRVSRITRSGEIDAVKIPPAKEIGNTGDANKAYEAALTISEELTALGINLDFAPCADLNNDNQGVIGDRAYSSEPETAAEFVQKAVEGFKEGGIICSLKHFPGHGVAPGDTHEQEILSEKSLEEILETDIIPFETGAEAGCPLIMLSHITVPEWGVPSSLCEEAVRYIRGEMAFDGIIITDSMRMGAITNYYSSPEAAVMAVRAGVNILLMPENTDEAFIAVASAVRGGEIAEADIDDSVYRILSLKYDYGFFDY